MNAKIAVRLLPAAIVMVLVGAACGSTPGPASGSPSAGSTGGLKVGMVLGGPKNDGSFSQASYEGMIAAQKEFGLQTQLRENVLDPTARLEALRELAQSNDIVIASSGAFAEAAKEVAPQFPKVTFLILNGQTSDAPNLFAYALREGVPAFIAGRVAAQLTKTGKVGFLGGEQIPEETNAQAGFKAGAESGGRPVQVESAVVGSFIDVAKAQQYAAAQLQDGVDLIYSWLDTAVIGVVRAMDEAGVAGGTFSIIAPRCTDSNRYFGTSIADVSALIVSMVRDKLNNQLPPQRLKLVGVEDPAVQRFELCPSVKTPELQKLVDDVTKGINDGSIKLPAGV